MPLTPQDLIHGIDATAEAEVSNAELNQLVDSAIAAARTGFVITTTDTALNTPEVPYAVETVGEEADAPVYKRVKWTRYLWRRLPFDSTGVVRMYIWNPNLTSNAIMLKWQDITEASSINLPRFVETVADLKAIDVTDLTENYYVFVLGYYHRNEYPNQQPTDSNMTELGGGAFVWRAGLQDTDDGGKIIAPTVNAALGKWERIFNGEMPNIRMWGAKGDKLNIDTLPIQRAMNSAKKYWFGTMRIPAGHYLIDDTIFFNSGVNVIGDSALGSMSILYMKEGVAKDILCTHNAAIGLGIQYDSTGYQMYATGTTLDWDHQLIVHNLNLQFLSSASYNVGTQTWTGLDTVNKTNAGLVICDPGEGHLISNLNVFGGGKFGVRCLGAGAPGLTLSCCSLHVWQYAVGMESVPGVGSGNAAVTLDRISADNVFWGEVDASLLYINRVLPNVRIHNFKMEGSFTGGVVRINCLPMGITENLGNVTIEGGSFNNGKFTLNTSYDLYFQNTLVKYVTDELDPSTVRRVPHVTMHKLQLYGAAYLIDDTIADYKVYTNHALIMDVGGTGVTQTCCETYEHYDQHYDSISGLRRVSIGKDDTKMIAFSPTQTGWYRVATHTEGGLSGTFIIGGVADGIKLDVTSRSSEVADSALMASLRQSTNANDGVSYVTKARMCVTKYWVPPADGNPGYWTPGRVALDIYVNSLPPARSLNTHNFQNSQIRVTKIGDNNTYFLGTMVKPTLIDPFNPEDYYMVEEIDLTYKGLVTTGGNYNRGHLVIGDNHIFFKDTKEPRLFTGGVDVIFVGGGGSGAQAKAFVRGGQVRYVKVTVAGAGYTSAPLAYLVPHERGIGSDCTLVATIDAVGGYVNGVTVANAGSNYSPSPSYDSGRPLLIETYNGQLVGNARRLASNATIQLTCTNGSIVCTDTGLVGLYDKLFVGDILRDPADGKTYWIREIVSNGTILLESNFGGVTGAITFRICGVQLLPPIAGKRYCINDVLGIVLGGTDWTVGAAGFNRILVRSNAKGGGGATQVFASFLIGTLLGTSTKVVPAFAQAVGDVGGLGGYLTSGYGVEAVMCVAANETITYAGAGSPVRIFVQGIKNSSIDLY